MSMVPSFTISITLSDPSEGPGTPQDPSAVRVRLEAPLRFPDSKTVEEDVVLGTHERSVPRDPEATAESIETFLRSESGAIDALLDNLREQIEEDIGLDSTVADLESQMTIDVAAEVVAAVRAG